MTSRTPPPRPPEPFETPNLDIVVNGFLSAIDTSHSGDGYRAQNERMAKDLDAAAREELRQLRQRVVALKTELARIKAAHDRDGIALMKSSARAEDLELFMREALHGRLLIDMGEDTILTRSGPEAGPWRWNEVGTFDENGVVFTDELRAALRRNA